MVRGATIPLHSTAERRPAAPADIPQWITAITAIPAVLGASILTPNTEEAEPVLAAATAQRSMPTMWTQTATASATIAAQLSA